MLSAGLAGPRGPVCRIAAVLLAALSLSSCYWPARGSIDPSHVRPLPRAAEPDGTLRIRTLRAALDSAGSVPVRVLVVHGMREREPHYSDALQWGIAARRLNLRRRERDSLIVLERDYEVRLATGARPERPVPLPPSEIRRRAWYDPATGRDRLVFYELLWAPTRDAVKDHFFGCFEAGPREGETCPSPAAARNADRRWWLNGILKADLMVDGFGDATVVLGPTGELLRDDVDLAFCVVASDILRGERLLAGAAARRGRCDLAAEIRASDRAAANRTLGQVRLFGVTHSLGSFLVMDAHRRYFLAHASTRAGADTVRGSPSCPPESPATVLGRPVADASDAARADALFYLLDNVTVFMRANQVSLLGLARLQPECHVFRGGIEAGAPCPNRSLPTVACGARAAGGFPRLSQYVAFNDTNDLLGFELPPYLAETGPFGKLVNVSVGNRHRYSIPFLFKNPGDAHTSSDRNPAILDAIVDGLPDPAPRSEPR